MQGTTDFNYSEAKPEETPAQTAAPPHPWILTPALDYLFCCGGMMWLLAGVEALGVKPDGHSYDSIILAGILFWGTLLIGEAHGPATLVRVFKSRTTPNYVRSIVVGWGIVLIVAAYYGMQNIAFAQVLAKITLIWVVQHYIAQTFGIILIYCMKRNFSLSKLERGLLQWQLRSLMFFVILRMFTVPAYGYMAKFIGLEVPFWGPLPFWPMYLAAVCFSFCSIGLTSALVWRYWRTKQIFPLPATLTIISVAALTMSQRDAFFLLGLTFYHSSQYLAVTYSYFVRERAKEAGHEIKGSLVKEFFKAHSLGYIFALALVGYLMTTGIPQGLIKNGVSEPVCLTVIWACLNLHHYFSDALIWRIRDKEVRELLV
ncbi:MAG: hypothetical protein WC714_21415 [Candidatus Obscuribacterales bacterium]|jgi:hypothetical protein